MNRLVRNHTGTLRKLTFGVVCAEMSMLIGLAAGVHLPGWLIAATGVPVAVLVAAEVSVGARHWRLARASGYGVRAASVRTLEVVLPAPVPKMLRFEGRLWLSLALWILRRQRGVGPGDRAFGYRSATMPVMWLFIGMSAAEIVVFELIIPWESLRVVLLVLGVYGLVLSIAALAAITVHPHLVRAESLLVRTGFGYALAVPLTRIETAHRDRRSHTGRSVALNDGALRLAVGGETTVRIVLRAAIDVSPPGGDRGGATEILVHADDPSALVRTLRDAVPAAHSS